MQIVFCMNYDLMLLLLLLLLLFLLLFINHCCWFGCGGGTLLTQGGRSLITITGFELGQNMEDWMLLLLLLLMGSLSSSSSSCCCCCLSSLLLLLLLFSLCHCLVLNPIADHVDLMLIHVTIFPDCWLMLLLLVVVQIVICLLNQVLEDLWLLWKLL